MSAAPHWSSEEFEVLLSNPLLTDAELTQQLPQRTAEALSIVRQGVHSWHTGRDDHQMLSQMMRQLLMARSRPTLCALCKTIF